MPAPIPPFNHEHERFRLAVREFVESELLPHPEQWEEARWYPNDVFRRLAERGYIGLKFPPDYGGRGDPVADAVFVEELARCGSGGVAAGIGAHSGIALPPIWRFGTDEQKRRYLIPESAPRRSAHSRSPNPTPDRTSPRSARRPPASTAGTS